MIIEMKPMDLVWAFLLSGFAISLYTLWRSRNKTAYDELELRLSIENNIRGLDLSGNTEYTRCFSHEWLMTNVVRKTHGQAGSLIQDTFMDNTFLATMCIGLAVGMFTLLIGIFYVYIVQTLGMAIVVFIIALFIILGPGKVKTSEQLLQAAMEEDILILDAEDYIYIKMSNDEYKKWLKTSTILGLLFILISPVSNYIPYVAAYFIGYIIGAFVIEPAQSLMLISPFVGIGYVVAMAILFGYLVPKTILVLLRKRR